MTYGYVYLLSYSTAVLPFRRDNQCAWTFIMIVFTSTDWVLPHSMKLIYESSSLLWLCSCGRQYICSNEESCLSIISLYHFYLFFILFSINRNKNLLKLDSFYLSQMYSLSCVFTNISRCSCKPWSIKRACSYRRRKTFSTLILPFLGNEGKLHLCQPIDCSNCYKSCFVKMIQDSPSFYPNIDCITANPYQL